MLFEWRASDHFPVHESNLPIGGQGKTKASAFDYFHINSVDKDDNGDYIASGRFYNTVTCIDGKSGEVRWQLGGKHNEFEDLSAGAATNFSWNHHASWVAGKRGTRLTIFDNGAENHHATAEHSRGLIIDLDVDEGTATLVHAYVSPQNLLTPSQGSVQILPSSNVLVGWGHTAAWTEFSADGEVLCDTHISPVWFANFGWVKNYRTFKFPWVGRPKTTPSRAMRASEGALYVSWNGATEVAKWRLQSSHKPDNGRFADHLSVKKTGFETRIEVPPGAG